MYAVLRFNIKPRNISAISTNDALGENLNYTIHTFLFSSRLADGKAVVTLQLPQKDHYSQR